VVDGAEQAGAEVRRRDVEELASELLISQNQYRPTPLDRLRRAGRDTRRPRVGQRRRVRNADAFRQRRRTLIWPLGCQVGVGDRVGLASGGEE
jgi:hypothetical protein